MERDTEKEVTPSIGPIHPTTREAEFRNLKRGSYSIFLEIHVSIEILNTFFKDFKRPFCLILLKIFDIYYEKKSIVIFFLQLYNTGDVLCSEPLHVAPAPAPDPPLVTVTVVGLDERRALERLTSDLVNKRDR